MKLKLAQRIALKYYIAKFRMLSLVSPRTAAEAAFDLFCTPYSGRPKRKIPPVFERAEKLCFTFNTFQLKGWRWKPEQPTGRKILIVHGFDSCSYKFDRYIVPFLKLGLEVVTFDAQGHGLSGGKTINGLLYAQSILKAETLYGPFHCVMAHSLGGLAAALAFEQLPEPEKRSLILLAPTTETTTAINSFFAVVKVSARVQKEFDSLIQEIGQQPVSYFSFKRIIQHIKSPVLWIHDEEDKVCPFEDTLPIQQMQLPHVEFFCTKGYGHNGIYRQNKVFKKVMEWIEAAQLEA